MKIHALKGVITVYGDQQNARDIEKGIAPGQRSIHHLSQEADREAKENEKKKPYVKPKRDKEKVRINADGETKRVQLDAHMPNRAVTIEAPLELAEEEELIRFLNKNQDVFAWSAADLKGVLIGTL